MRWLKGALLALVIVLAAPHLAWAQTAATGTITGTVTDATGAVVPGAEIEITNPDTNLTKKVTSNEAGLYTILNVQPGTYTISASMKGFRRGTITNFKVDVGKSYNLPFTLEVGDVATTVEVRAATAVEIQTLDATVGNAVGGSELLRLPTANRSAASLLLLQPLVTPGRGVGNDVGGQVAGARSDQTTFLLDGGDSTSNTEGSGGYNSGFDGTPLPMIPVPVESIEEFRVGTTNPNATFGRSQGGQVMLVTKRGTNNLHGSAYWYHQNDNLNAAAWSDKTRCARANPASLPFVCQNENDVKPELIDNRYGFTLGGPVMKDRLFLFGHYEGRNFPRTAASTRNVPSTLLRQGILQFRDASGVVRPYNLATSTACGPTGTTACDPRALGISPVVSSIFNTLPASNASGGDNLNTAAYSFNLDNTLKEQFFVARLDYKINDIWNFFGSFRYGHTDTSGTQQLDITGISGCTAPCSTRVNPLEPRYLVWGVNGQIKPNLISETRFSWYRHWWEWGTRAPFAQTSTTAAAVLLGGEGTGAGGAGATKIADPINFDTQNARSRIWNGKDSYIAQNLSWLAGRHTVQFGGNFRNENIFHQRTDRVVGGLSGGPMFWLRSISGGGGNSLTIPDTSRPPICSATLTTNCLVSSDIGRWNTLYSAVLGMVDQSAQVLTRDGQFNAQPLGTGLEAQVTIRAYEMYFQDVWRWTNNLTLTYGLTYQIQMPPTEELGRQAITVYAATGEPIDLDSYFFQRATAASKGLVFNPDIAFSPIRSTRTQKYVTPVDWNNLGPRISAAWQPQFDNFLFGKGKTALRGGWGVTYTRMNGVGLVMTPVLGTGLGQILACRGPNTAGTCTGATSPLTAFRVGPDGTGANILPSTLPVPPGQIPFPIGAPFGETFNFGIDSGMELGRSHSFDFTWQRELPGNHLMEIGYVGRLGRNLTQNADLNAFPFFQVDPISGQTAAQAFEAVAAALRSGATVANQPFFENSLGPGGVAALYGAGASYSQLLASFFPSELRIGDMASIFLFGIDQDRLALGLTPYNNIQGLFNSITSDHGWSDYHAMFFSIRKRSSRGLAWDFNYTLAKSTDTFGINQENTLFSWTSPFNREFDVEPSLFDVRHAINTHWYYELPFGRGKRFSTDNSFLNKVVGGWHVAGLFTSSSGLPDCAFVGGNYGALTAGTCANGSAKITENALQANQSSSVANPLGAGTVTVASAGNQTCGATGCSGGNGFNMFADPGSVYSNFRVPVFTQDTRHGFGTIRGFPRWNVDISLGKKTTFYENYSLVVTLDFLNAFNHMEWNNPSLNLSSPSTFGVVSSQFGRSRFIQLGLRFEF